MKHTRRTRSLKNPFVQTFAAGAAALLTGCGSAVVTDTGCDGGGCEDRPTPPVGCPAREPAAGSACAAPVSSTCTYGSRFNGCVDVPIAYTCDATRHVWMQQINTCNPPAPTCPNTPPAQGTSCVAGIGPACTWPAGVCNGVAQTITGRCDPATRQWQVERPVCAPPTCPEALPANGAACANPPSGMLMCRYPGMPCGGVNNDVYAQCDESSHTWRQLISSCNPPAPSCPPTLPQAGTSCISTPVTQNCNYPAMPCLGVPQTQRVSCDPGTQTWQVQGVPSCNPPPPPPDAGVSDGGAVDAGVRDGGVVSSDV